MPPRHLHHTKEQDDRIKKLAKHCRSKIPMTKMDELMRFKNSAASAKQHLYTSHKKHIVYCGAPKVASTNWKKILLVFEEKIKDIKQIKQKNNVHLMNFDRLFNLIGKGHIAQILKHYYKFLFVRHPFERLVSSYRNKFYETNNTYFQRMYGSRILRMHRNNLTDEEFRAGKGVTFKEFITWIVEKKVYDPHWVPIYYICFPCIIPYDFIGKMESLKSDSKQIFKDIETEYIFPIDETDGYSVSSRELMVKYFKNISYETKKKVYWLYREDFKAFGYTIPIEIYNENETHITEE